MERHPATPDAADLQHAVLKRLRKQGAEFGWWPADSEWQRSYARFLPERDLYCIQLFDELGPDGQRCLALLQRSPPGWAAEGISSPLELGDLGWLTLARFPHDPQLPTLARVLRENHHVRVVRYRPLLRCTLSALDEYGEPAFAKVFPDQRGLVLHEQGCALWQAANEGALAFKVARPGRWDAQSHTLWQGVVSGMPVLPRMQGRQGPSLARILGRSCASLTQAPLTAATQLDGRAQMQRSQRYGREIALALPGQSEALAQLLERLEKIHVERSRDRLYPVHGAPHLHQWLIDAQQPGLIDFDGFTLGDPELDVAAFIGDMDFENPDKLPVTEINAAFVAGYQSVFADLDPVLLSAYRAHKRLKKVVKNLRSLHPRRLDKAARHLRMAMDAVTTTG